MRKLPSIVAVCVVAVTALVMTRCTSVTGRAPTDATLAAATDSTVTVSWTAPTEATPDKYYVAFMATGASTYTDVDTTPNGTTTSYVHYPAGQTGTYKVTAVFGSTTYDASTTPSTASIATTVLTVSELNASGNSGYGWDRTTGVAVTYPMTVAGNADGVDFYITDFAAGHAGTIYSIASPGLGPSDSGAVVPPGSWKANRFSNALANERDPLPAHSVTTYFDYTDLTTDPILVGCYTADGYYALVKLSGINTGAGTVSVQSWFQTIKGLRLIQH
jgi:hypothetical protein